MVQRLRRIVDIDEITGSIPVGTTLRHPERKLKIQEMRRNGESVRDIARILDCPKSMVSYHCKDIILTEDQLRRLDDKRKRVWAENAIKGREASGRKWEAARKRVHAEALNEWDTLKDDPEFMMFLGLYLGEGSKSCSQVVRIANNDPRIVVYCTSWFKKLSNAKMRCTITYYHNHDVEKCLSFWSELLDMSITLKPNKDDRGSTEWCDRCKFGRCEVTFSDWPVFTKLMMWMSLWENDTSKIIAKYGNAKIASIV